MGYLEYLDWLSLGNPLSTLIVLPRLLGLGVGARAPWFAHCVFLSHRTLDAMGWGPCRHIRTLKHGTPDIGIPALVTVIPFLFI